MSEKCSLLLVDDDRELLEILQQRFVRRGFVVTVCNEAHRVIALVESQKFDVAVIDRTLWGADGLEVVRQLKELVPSLPVIVLSGWSDADSVDQAYRAGAVAYRTKPCELGELQAVVQAAWRGTLAPERPRGISPVAVAAAPSGRAGP
jgi:DNA-binding NtrC family response regulator